MSSKTHCPRWPAAPGLARAGGQARLRASERPGQAPGRRPRAGPGPAVGGPSPRSMVVERRSHASGLVGDVSGRERTADVLAVLDNAPAVW